MKAFVRTITGFLFAAVLLLCGSVYANNELDALSQQNPGVVILCYHDIGKYDSPQTTMYSMDTKNLEGNIKYLLSAGYTFLSLDDYIAINKKEKPLPAKAVMLTFDDGYESFYKTVYPLLQKYQVPAMMAIIGSWMDGGASAGIKMSTWEQFKEMEASGLVAVASHTYDLHKPVLINDYGENGPAVGSRIFRNGRYETEAAYRERISYDFAKAQKQMEENLGHRVKALVWPFGAHTDISMELAKKAGFEATFILSDGINPPSMQSLERARRGIIYSNVSGSQLPSYIKSLYVKDFNLFRFAKVKISDVYAENDLQQTDANIDMLVNRLMAGNAWRVALQAFEDTNGNTSPDAAFFYNRQAPVKKDIFNHIAGRLIAEGIEVYAWMPTLSQEWLLDKDRIRNTDGAVAEPKRWNMMDMAKRKKLIACFRDLAVYSPLSGVYFTNADLFVRDNEDFSPRAKEAYKKKVGRELTPNILKKPEELKAWSDWKVQVAIDLTNDIMAAVRAYRPEARSVRHIDASVVMEPEKGALYAQDYGKFLSNYDYTVITVSPQSDKSEQEMQEWLAGLGEKAMLPKGAADQVVVQFVVKDALTGEWLKPSTVRSWSEALGAKGIKYFSYYPETMMEEEFWYFPNTSAGGTF